jgi:hypothetical protein
MKFIEKIKSIYRNIDPLYIKIFLMITLPIWFLPFALFLLVHGFWEIVSDYVDGIH